MLACTPTNEYQAAALVESQRGTVKNTMRIARRTVISFPMVIISIRRRQDGLL